MKRNRVLTGVLLMIFIAVFVAACGSGGSSDDGAPRCDIVANADGPGYLEVINNLSTGLEWYMQDYAFSADMKPGECTIFGVATGTRTVELTQCDIADAACTLTFGPTKSLDFSVADGETYTISVDKSFFQ